jgi:hypothetical protein
MSAKREAEKQEALGHLVYFKEMLAAKELAIRRMETNVRLCKKNIKLWEGRLERLQPKRPKAARSGVE